MFPAERRRRIQQIVLERGTVKIGELAGLLGVSDMTIHRDLAKLEESGSIEKSHGGVLSRHLIALEPDFVSRSRSNTAEKEDIAALAIEYVNEGDAVLLDASTTCLALARRLKRKRNITVFVTGLYAQSELICVEDVAVYSSGGMLSSQTSSYVGPQTIAFLDQVHVDTCFIGSNSVDVEHGISDPYLLEAEVKRHAAANADQVILLADHSKFGHASMFISVPLFQVDLIITDGREENPFLAEIEKAGIASRIAPRVES